MENANADLAGFTIIIIKPDGLRRNLRGTILDLYSEAGLEACNYHEYEEGAPGLLPLFAEHYREHKNKEFYRDLVTEMAKGPICVLHMVSKLSPEDTAAKGREVMAQIRDKYAESLRHNTVHASDSPEAAQREHRIWFTPSLGCAL